jgi:hypothetical protein
MNQKGVSLYLAVVLMTMLLALVLGISTILLRQLQSIRGMEDSVVALYAADSGIEQVLVDVIGNRTDPIEHYNNVLSNGASYSVDVVCCQSGSGDCAWGGGFDCPPLLLILIVRDISIVSCPGDFLVPRATELKLKEPFR